VSGKIIKPSDTLANKECLKFYYQFAKVEELHAKDASTVKAKL
jgi:acetoacetyl-CoA synthetase